MSILLNYMKKNMFVSISVVLLMVMEVAINVWQPKLMAQIVDYGILTNHLDYVIGTGTVMLILSVGGGIAGLLATVSAGILAAKIGNDLRKDLFAKIVDSELSELGKISSASKLNRLSNDCNGLVEFIADFVHVVIKPLLLIVFGFFMVFKIHPAFGVVVLLFIPVQLIMMTYLYKRTSKMFAVIQGKIDVLTKYLREGIIGAKVIKAFRKETYEKNRFETLNADVKGSSFRVWKMSAGINALVSLAMNTVVLVIIYLGGLQAQAEAVQIGHILAAITYVQQIIMSLMSLGLLFKYLTQLKVAAARIADILKLQPETKSFQKELEQGIDSIRFQNVQYRNEKGKNVFHDLTFELQRGERVGIIGSTGSGKTTLINLMTGLCNPTDGQIEINGEDMKQFRPGSIRTWMAVATQENGLFAGTLRENIAWDYAGDYEASARLAQADSFIREMSDAYETVIYDKGGNLSGGQKQRVLMARAIHRLQDVMIVDDALTEVDAHAEQAIYQNLKELCEHKILIIASQRASVVNQCEKIIVLAEGAIEAIGSHEQLMETSQTYKQLYDSQVKGELL